VVCSCAHCRVRVHISSVFIASPSGGAISEHFNSAGRANAPARGELQPKTRRKRQGIVWMKHSLDQVNIRMKNPGFKLDFICGFAAGYVTIGNIGEWQL
jgi:hypothetical protein